jgi:hypothetical protein
MLTNRGGWLYCDMPEDIRLKDKYVLARCCSPSPGSPIVGYFSYDDIIKVHRQGCRNLTKAERERLVSLDWKDIIEGNDFRPGDDYGELEDNDFRILEHHRDLGVDYSLKTASVIHLPKQDVFDRHRKLRDMGLLKRVEPVMIRYRKGVVDNKWIKHRNHTYYELTPRGRDYLTYFLNQKKS